MGLDAAPTFFEPRSAELGNLHPAELLAADGQILAVETGVAKDFIAWGCIGLAAALGAGMWPFPRGFRGLSLNLAAAVVGAIGGAVLGGALGLMRSNGDPNALAFAALGALVLLWFVHVLWGRFDRSAGHAHR